MMAQQTAGSFRWSSQGISSTKAAGLGQTVAIGSQQAVHHYANPLNGSTSGYPPRVTGGKSATPGGSINFEVHPEYTHPGAAAIQQPLSRSFVPAPPRVQQGASGVIPQGPAGRVGGHSIIAPVADCTQYAGSLRASSCHGAGSYQGSARGKVPVGVEVVLPSAATAQNVLHQEFPKAAFGSEALRQRVVASKLPTLPTMAGVEHMEPEGVYQMMKEKRCLLVDVRGNDRASGIIDGSVHIQAVDNVPFIMKIPEMVQKYSDQELVVFTCQHSEHRAPQCANWYREKANPRQRVGILVGGYREWEAKGLPVRAAVADLAASTAFDNMAMQQGMYFAQTAAQQTQPCQRQFGSGSSATVAGYLQAQPQSQLQQALMQQPQIQHMRSVQTGPANNSYTPLPTQIQRRPYNPPILPNTVPTIGGVEHLDPEMINHLLRGQQCVLVDLRGEDRASGLIDGAVHVPAIDKVPFLSKVPELVQRWSNEPLVVFTCQYSAHRAPQCANWYREKADKRQRVGILAGGFRGWEARGLPVVSAASNNEQGAAADEFAMQQGVHFVQQHAPHVYRRAQSLHQHLQNSQQQALPIQPTQVPPLPYQPPNQQVNAQTRAPSQSGQLPRPAHLPSYVPQSLPTTVPTIGGIDHLEPENVFQHLKNRSCTLVDLRGDDRAAGLIDGAVHVPAIDKVPFVSKVPDLVQRFANESLVVFTCQYSAHRAPQCANWYREKCDPQQRVAILAGGFRGWEAKGLPVASPATLEDGIVADDFAMQQGVQFVKQHAPQIYYRALSLQPQKVEHQQQHLQQQQLVTPTPSAAMSQGNGQNQMFPQMQVHSQPQPSSPTRAQALLQQQQQQLQQLQQPQQPQQQQQQLATPMAVDIQLRNYTPPNLPTTVPTSGGVEHLEPEQVYHELQMKTAVLIDLRDDDRAAGLIEPSLHLPAVDKFSKVPFVEKIPELCQRLAREPLVVFTCQYSAHRAPQCANWYRQQCDPRQRVAILTGGFRGWEGKGLPVAVPSKTVEESIEADNFAMQQGVHFVKQHAPQIYQRAQNLQPHKIQERERQEKERQEREREERERLESERQERERQERDRETQERQELQARQRAAAQERQTQERLDRERQELERREREEEERQRERQECERQDRERQDRERQMRETQERERQERERQIRETQERERQERDRQERERLERERQERERHLRERQERERQEKERQDRERQDRERQERERRERMTHEKVERSTPRQAADRSSQQRSSQLSRTSDRSSTAQERRPTERSPAAKSSGRPKPQAKSSGLSRGEHTKRVPKSEDFPPPAQVQTAQPEDVQPLQTLPVQPPLTVVQTVPQVVQGVQPASGSSQPGWLSASEISGQSVPMSTQLQPSTATTTAPATVVTTTAVSAPQPLSTLPLVPLTPMSHLPTMEGVDKIDPSEVFQLLQDKQAILIDLRDDDRKAGLIDGALHVPAIDKVPFVAKVPDLAKEWFHENMVIFTCQYSRHRAPQCANQYREQSNLLNNSTQRVGVLAGGFRGWEAKGLPVQSVAESAEIAAAADSHAITQGAAFVRAAQAQH